VLAVGEAWATVTRTRACIVNARAFAVDACSGVYPSHFISLYSCRGFLMIEPMYEDEKSRPVSRGGFVISVETRSRGAA
jgi:hypothetical protein